MPCGVAHVIQVIVLSACADASLTARSSGVATILSQREGFLELDHTRIREQQSRIIVWNERGRLDDGVPLTGKIVEIGLTNLVAVHGMGSSEPETQRCGLTNQSRPL